MSTNIKLEKDFFLMPATQLAPLLLGKVLCRRLENGEILRRKICETECYFGETDSACHARFGKTLRTQPMYSEGGITYVYLCYGIHYLLNIVSGNADHPEAVLIRGVEDAIGPGRVTKLFQIDKGLNCEDLCTSDRLWIEESNENVDGKICFSHRVGIEYAKQADRDVLWRFILKS